MHDKSYCWSQEPESTLLVLLSFSTPHSKIANIGNAVFWQFVFSCSTWWLLMVYDHFILYLEPDGWAANFVLPSTILSTLLTVKEKNDHYIKGIYPFVFLQFPNSWNINSDREYQIMWRRILRCLFLLLYFIYLGLPITNTLFSYFLLIIRKQRTL